MRDDQGLDLVEIAPNAEPPVCKMLDYRKFKYEQDRKAKAARKNQSRVEVKEMKFRPKIDVGDYETKKGHVIRFLKKGARVKITIMFRGREMAHPEQGRMVLDRLAEDLKDVCHRRAEASHGGSQHAHDHRPDQGRLREEGLMRGRAMSPRRRRTSMPKMKTHKGTAKRFRRTGSGKIMRAKAFKSHILTKKSPKRIRGFRQETVHLPRGRQDRLRSAWVPTRRASVIDVSLTKELIRYGTSQARRRRP